MAFKGRGKKKIIIHLTKESQVLLLVPKTNRARSFPHSPLSSKVQHHIKESSNIVVETTKSTAEISMIIQSLARGGGKLIPTGFTISR